MYNFEDDLAEKALHYYTLLYCGEFDEDFYYQVAAESFFDEALSICITLDYLDMLYENFIKSSPVSGSEYEKSLDVGSKMDYNRFTRR